MFHKYGDRPDGIRRAKREFFLRLSLVFGVFLFFAMMILLTRLSPRLDSESREAIPDPRNIGDLSSNAEINRMRAEVDQLMLDYEEQVAELGNVPEALEKLEEAIRVQQDVLRNRGSDIAPRADVNRLEELQTLREEEEGKLVFSDSLRLEQKARELYLSGAEEEAISLLEEARKKQEEVNSSYSRSSASDPSRLHKLTRQLVEWQATPMVEKANSLRSQAQSFLEALEYDSARKTMEEAVEIVRTLNQNFRRTRFSSLSRLREFEAEFLDIQAAEDAARVEDLMNLAKDQLANEDHEASLESAEAALALQRGIEADFSGSRFANEDTQAELDALRLSAIAYPLAQEVLGQYQNLIQRLESRNTDEIAPEIADLFRKGRQLQSAYAESQWADPQRWAVIQFWHQHRSRLPELQAAVYSQLIPLRSDSKNSLLSHEFPQEWYEILMESNPSNQSGARLPVDSATWDEAVTCLSRLSWILGRQARLPSREEYVQAIGEPTLSRIMNQSVNAGTSGRTTQAVASRTANRFGYHDLLGNVSEWVGETLEEDETQVSAIGGSARDSAARLTEIPEEERSRTERNRFIGFRFVLESDTPPGPLK